MSWYAFDILAYQTDTAHLTTLEHGAYRLLIDHYMLTRSPLPDNDIALARLALMPLAEWELIAPTIRAFFVLRSGKLQQKKCDSTLDAEDKMATKRSVHAQKAANARWAGNNDLHAPGINGHRLSIVEQCPDDAPRCPSMLPDQTR